MATTKHPLPVPAPIRGMNGRLSFIESEVNNYIRSLAGLPLLEPSPDAPVKVISAMTFAERLDVNRRTLGRRIRNAVRTAEAGSGEAA
jgi:hypothetical protein